MRILGNEHTKRESIYLILIVFLLMCFFLIVWIEEKQAVQYHNKLIGCQQKIIDWNSGNNMDDVWGNPTINITKIIGETNGKPDIE